MQYTAEEMKWLQDQGIRFLYDGLVEKWKFDIRPEVYSVFRPDEDRAERFWNDKFGKNKSTKTPHKHAEFIKAFADGKDVQMNSGKYGWESVNRLSDFEHIGFDYRIKPVPTPDEICFGFCPGLHDQDSYPRITNIAMATDETDNIKFTFDGETGKLKSVEMIGE